MTTKPESPDPGAELHPDALYALRHHQRQLDSDGVEVGVSRQALEEAIAFIDRTYAAQDVQSAGDQAVAWIHPSALEELRTQRGWGAMFVVARDWTRM